MTYPNFNSGDILTATDMNALGMYKMTPTSVNNATLSGATVIPNSAVSTVTINGVFTADYDNYIISASGVTASSGGGVLYGKLTSNSVPQTNGWYGNTFFISAGGAGSLSNATVSNAATFEICCLTNTTNHKNAGVCNIQAPFLSNQTRAQYNNADDYYFRLGAFHLSNTNSYDGVQILPSGGTISGGEISIFGFKG